MTSTPRARHARPLGVVLAGGGARAAYQVGVLHWIARHHPELDVRLWTGVSAGAINAAFLANRPGSLSAATESLAALWGRLKTEAVIEAHTGSLAWSVLKWGVRLVTAGTPLLPPVQGMVKTEPLRNLLKQIYDAQETPQHELTGVAQNISQGRLDALAVTTTDYGSGQTVTWVHGRDFVHWDRPLRKSELAVLTVEHIMASTAVPLFSPAFGSEKAGTATVGSGK